MGNRIRALPGPEYREFGRASQSVLAFAMAAQSQSNRMGGYRLQGQSLTRTCNGSPELLSHRFAARCRAGALQRNPIVLMNDAQTTEAIRALPASSRQICHLAQIR
ncbi:hypothetical protein KCP75_02575 [Salmonella enterica subsp. enterica]|nr:hypothetical protein KCP75_02575 [Salmonella enterica subsp. enterica]